MCYVNASVFLLFLFGIREQKLKVKLRYKNHNLLSYFSSLICIRFYRLVLFIVILICLSLTWKKHNVDEFRNIALVAW